MEEQSSTNLHNHQSAKGLKIATIILIVVALAGVGFSIYQVCTNQKQKNNYESQLQAKDQTISELQNQQKEQEQPSVETASISGYIYVGAWGLKIKVSDNLKNVSYLYKTETDSVSIWGMSTGHGDEIPFFAKPLEYSSVLGTHNHSPLGYLMRVKRVDQESCKVNCGVVVREDGDMVFAYLGPQAPTGESNTQAWEVESADLIKNMLSNPENYSAI